MGDAPTVAMTGCGMISHTFPPVGVRPCHRQPREFDILLTNRLSVSGTAAKRTTSLQCHPLTVSDRLRGRRSTSPLSQRDRRAWSVDAMVDYGRTRGRSRVRVETRAADHGRVSPVTDWKQTGFPLGRNGPSLPTERMSRFTDRY